MASIHFYCTACGTANQAQDSFCFACGHRLRATTSLTNSSSVVSASSTQTGYKMMFKRLEPGLDKVSVIKHDFKVIPLVDVYQLDYFQVVCATGIANENMSGDWVNFYLYHSTEKRIRLQDQTYDIEPVGQQPYSILFKEMLDRYSVQYADTTTLGDVEISFWKAFFQSPTDVFQANQYCHSPAFEQHRGEQVAVLKQQNDWDNMWFQMRPRKTIDFPAGAVGDNLPGPAPTQIQVTHFDFDTLGITLLMDPQYPQTLDMDANDPKRKWLNVLLLLRV